MLSSVDAHPFGQTIRLWLSRNDIKWTGNWVVDRRIKPIRNELIPWLYANMKHKYALMGWGIVCEDFDDATLFFLTWG